MTRTLKATQKQRGGVTGKGFLPGQSGNPGGRSPGEKTLLRRLYGADGEKLYARLEQLRTDRRTSAKLKVAIDRFLIERLHGRARQHVEVEGGAGLVELLAAARAADGGTR